MLFGNGVVILRVDVCDFFFFLFFFKFSFCFDVNGFKEYVVWS